MTRTRTYVQEASRLAEKRDDGSYRVILITEGVGSTGIYSAELMDASEHVFEGVASYMDHPIDPERPDKRPVLSIGGRFKNVQAEDGPHGRQLAADFTPRDEYRKLFEDFADIIGLSIYCGAYGEPDESGRVVVESFDYADPYRSVDVVVAAGRGGRFKRAEESLRAIESSLGLPQGKKPGATAAQESNQSEDHMELKDVEALLDQKLAEALTPINTFLAAEDARRQAEADAADKTGDVAKALEAFATTSEAIKAAKVLPKLEAKLIESAKTGVDVTADLAFAKEVTAEALASARGGSEGSFFVHESRVDLDADVSLGLGGGL